MSKLGLMPKFLSDREALQVNQAVEWQGAALMGYLRRARESALQGLMCARASDDVVRMQGAAQMMDDLIEKLEASRKTADAMEKK
jgi:hypothetical protein